VHGRGFELTFGKPVDCGVVHGRGFESLNFGVNGVVVHGRGFESFILGVNGGECMVKGLNLGLFGGQLWCNNHLQNQQRQIGKEEML
jgi:hypothetical protein